MALKILVVDDEPDVEPLFRQHFRREIRKNQYEFSFALSGKEALAHLETTDSNEMVHLISDINMPEMTGIELLELVKAKTPDLPVIMITAYGDEETKARVLEKGAEQLISKPVDFTLLKQELGKFADTLGS